jgi:hypothetical protein
MSLSLVDTIVIAIVVPVVVVVVVIALTTYLLYRRRVRLRRERKSARLAAAATPPIAAPQQQKHHHHRVHEYDRVPRKSSRRGHYAEMTLVPAAAVADESVPQQEYGPMVFNKRAEYRQSMAQKSPSSRRRHVKDRPAHAELSDWSAASSMVAIRRHIDQCTFNW